MKDWQVDLIIERDELEIKIRKLSFPKDNMYNICKYAERLYHLTKYLQSLDKEIASWSTSGL